MSKRIQRGRPAFKDPTKRLQHKVEVNFQLEHLELIDAARGCLNRAQFIRQRILDSVSNGQKV